MGSYADILSGIIGGIAGLLDNPLEAPVSHSKSNSGNGKGKTPPRKNPAQIGAQAGSVRKGFYADGDSDTGWSYSNPQGRTQQGVQRPEGREKIITQHGRTEARNYHPALGNLTSPNILSQWDAFVPRWTRDTGLMQGFDPIMWSPNQGGIGFPGYREPGSPTSF